MSDEKTRVTHIAWMRRFFFSRGCVVSCLSSYETGGKRLQASFFERTMSTRNTDHYTRNQSRIECVVKSIILIIAFVIIYPAWGSASSTVSVISNAHDYWVYQLTLFT